MAMRLLCGVSAMKETSNISGARRGKGLLVCLLWLLCAAGFLQSRAVDVKLAWDASADPTVIGYKLYYGVVGGLKQTMNVGAKTVCTVSSLVGGKTYEFSVTAYTSSAESDPSNLLTFTPPSPVYYMLAVSPFKNGFAQISPRGDGVLGNLYPAGTQVTLTATPKSGATFGGWNINGVVYPNNTQTFTMGADTLVAPYFRLGEIALDAVDSGASMSMQLASGLALLTVGGEIGAWTVEQSSDLKSWQIAGSGLTSAQVPIGGGGNGFFRVRAFNAATDQ